jgi:hypothetical protein
MKDTKSILLLLVSICLIGSWVFHVYDKSKYAVVKPHAPQIESSGLHQSVIDSLEQRYQIEKQALEQMRIGNDSLSQELKAKWRQLDSLRSQIDRMMSLSRLPGAESSILQTSRQVTRNKEAPLSTTGSSKQVSIPSHSAPVQFSSGLNASDFQINNNRLSAPLQLSFQIYQNSYSIDNAQLYVVVKDPSGSVLQDDQWSAGVFPSQKEGILKYSKRIRFDYVRGEHKRLQVEVPAASLQKGRYEVLVYHNGLPIGSSLVALQ